MSRLFGTAGIRKVYPSEVNGVLAYKLGLTVAELVGNKGTGYIVHDTRTTSPLLSLAFMAGLMAGGVDAGYIGLAPTPVVAYASLWHGVVGASITASHNPPEYNGFKFYDKDGYEFTRILEEEIEKLIDAVKEKEWKFSRNFFYAKEVIDEYIDDLTSRLTPEKKKWEPKVVIDVANGASYYVTPTVVRILGGNVITVNANPDGYFPGRSPEPRKDVLEKLLPLYSSIEPATILAHDGDADRLAVLSPRKGFIRQDRILAFYAALLLADKKGGLVIVSIDTGRVVDYVVEKYGGKIERYILGKTHERVKELGSKNVVMAGEPWKLIDPSWGPWVDGVWQVGLIMKKIVEEGKPFDKILDDMGIPDYPWDRRSYLIEPVDIRDRVYDEIVEELKHVLGEPTSVITIDGYRYEYDDGSWILVRKSGTEPKIRVYSEAPNKDRLKNMIDVFERIFIKIVKRHHGKIKEKTIG